MFQRLETHPELRVTNIVLWRSRFCFASTNTLILGFSPNKCYKWFCHIFQGLRTNFNADANNLLEYFEDTYIG